MINTVIADSFLPLIDTSKLEAAALAVLTHQQIPVGSDLSIVVDDDDYLHQLNLEFLKIDSPTDVLSFPVGENEVDPETGQPYLGDVIISYPRAAEQASTAGHTVTDEMQLLVVHGVLHLLGHDHAMQEEKAVMWAAQREILTNLNVKINHLPE